MKSKLLFFISVFIYLISVQYVFSQKQVSTKNLTNNYVKMNINKISTYFQNDGITDIKPYSSDGGCFYPVSKYLVVYQSGLVWGGKVGAEIRVGGTTYNSGLQPGKVYSSGNASDPVAATARAYKVRRDFKTANLSTEAADEGVGVNQIYGAYEKDWNEWPANDGAPFEDVNKNGKYDPATDVPGVVGADVTIWYVTNDLDNTRTTALYGSKPMGIEMQVTVWAYKDAPLDEVVFKKYLLINKSKNTFSDMYVSQWVDPDMGLNAYDDLAGCDTLLNLGYSYESQNISSDGSLSPAAIGWYLYQGPIVKSTNSNEVGTLNGYKRSGYTNLPMTSFYTFFNGEDPQLRNYDVGTLGFYNYMQGKLKNGISRINPLTQKAIKFSFPGEPNNGTGWLDTQPNDVRLGLSSGPFNMAAGDTQEVIIAFYGASSLPQTNGHLKNLSSLKQRQPLLQNFLKNGLIASIIAPEFIQINQSTQLSLKFANSNKADGISTVKWEYSKTPNGSKATITNSTQQQPNINFDIVGEYEIKLTVNTVQGNEIIVFKSILGINNRTPIAKIKLNKYEIDWGDSVLVQCNESSDPDNDNLTYELSANYRNFDQNTKSTYAFPAFGPAPVGKNYVTLKVSDKYASSTVIDSFFVKPRLVDVKINFSYVDPDWTYATSSSGVRGLNFYKGKDTLLVPTQIGLKRYSLTSTGVEYKETYPIIVDGVWGIRDNFIFTAADNRYGYYGTIGFLSVMNMDNNFVKLISNYAPDLNDISSCIIYKNELLLGNMVNGLFLIDISNIYTPKVKASYTFTNINRGRLKETDRYYYFLQRLQSSGNHYITKLDRTNLSKVDEISTDILYSRAIAAADSILIAYTSTRDTCFVYKFDSYDKSPKLISTFMFSNYIQRKYKQLLPYDNYSASFLNKNVLIIKSPYDMVLVDINKLIKGAAKSEIVLAELGGFSNSFTFIDRQTNYYFVYGDNRYASGGGYMGINGVTFDKISDIEKDENGIPLKFALSQNYPNPFNPATQINYSLPYRTHVTLEVFNLLGEKINTLFDGIQPAGNYKATFNGNGIANGVYFYRIKADNYTETKKFILLK